MGCTHASRDFVGAPRPDGKGLLGPEALAVEDSRRQRQEEQLDFCHKSSQTSDVIAKQRNEVEGIIATGSKQLCATGSEAVASKSYSEARSNSKESMSGSKYCNVFSLNSQEQYMDPDQTIIIFDWDDTLCPSTWCKRNARFDQKGKLLGKISKPDCRELSTLCDQVIPLLRAARAMAKVVLVTNARRPWVDTSCKALMPGVGELLQDIEIIYAMELLKEEERADFVVNPYLLTESKARAMKAAISGFYSRYPGQSWKNIVSVGDALYEHDAIRQVARERPDLGLPVPKKCRTKTVKLIEGPTIMGLSCQLNLVESWLAKLIQADHDVDVDLGADEDTINKWVKQFGPDF